jgi:tetratricopeptide (TPR) repeat protein
MTHATGVEVTAISILLFGAACATAAPTATSNEDRPSAPDPAPALHSSDARIAYYRDRIEKEPKLYPAYLMLGSAYADKARESGEARWLADARAALLRSIELQPQIPTYTLMMQVENYAHRFAEALRWAKSAADGSPPRNDVLAGMVEAYMGLGEDDEARGLLPPDGVPAPDFHTAAARGQWYAANARIEPAVGDFLRAAELARGLGWREAEVWAYVVAGGAHIDHGDAADAEPHLAAAEAIAPRDTLLRIHRAEVHAAKGELTRALAIYEELLGEKEDAGVHSAAFLVAHRLGDAARAQAHFEAAERGYSAPIDSGEVYSLNALASLYLEAGVKLERARELAKKNLEYKRDREAKKTLEGVEAKLAGK